MLLVDLTKKAKVSFEKKGLNLDLIKPAPMDVVLALDVSGSMERMFKTGVVQKTLDKLFAVATLLDADKQLDVWVFDDASNDLPEHMNEKNYENYVNKFIMNSNVDKWGGTFYAGVMQDIIDSYYDKKVVGEKVEKKFLFFTNKEQVFEYVNKSGKPVMVLFITDGETSYPEKAEQIVANNTKSIYWNFIGVGSSNFSVLKNIANKYGNAGFVKLTTLDISDEELYNNVLTQEVINFIKKS